MRSDINTQLVNIDSLNTGMPVERTHELMEHVSALFLVAGNSCSVEQLDQFDAVLLRLSELVELDSRAELAKKLAPIDFAPRSVVRRLAHDRIEVAQPIIIYSPVLDDLDLCYIADTLTLAHRSAMTGRSWLSETVTDSLLVRAELDVLRGLAANARAELSREGAARLVQHARSDKNLSSLVSKRGDLGFAVATADDPSVPDGAADAAGSDHIKPAPAYLMTEDAVVAASDRSYGPHAMRFDFVEARTAINGLAHDGDLTVETLSGLADRDDFAEAVCTMTLLTRTAFDDVLEAMTDSDVTRFLVLCSANRLSEALVSALLRCGPWRIRLARDTREKAMERFNRLSPSVAQRIVRSWGMADAVH